VWQTVAHADSKTLRWVRSSSF